MSPRKCLELITQYAPPYDLRRITVTLGTVASPYANINLAPCVIIPAYSCPEPGKNPGTSTNVNTGMLKASQYYTKASVMNDTRSSRMTSHQAIKENVYLTQFSNGVKVYVNYNDTAVEVNDIYIGAKSFVKVG